jgi:hypothetical protein
MAYGVPIGRLRQRLLWPASNKLNRKQHGAVDPPPIEERGGLAVYTWARDAVPAVLEEGDLPDWFDPHPRVELSGFDSWTDVARWTATLYDAVEPGTSSLDALIGQWASRGSLEERALLAVRFVQDEVRYLGLEIGPGAWEPRSPATVLAKRYGDCKAPRPRGHGRGPRAPRRLAPRAGPATATVALSEQGQNVMSLQRSEGSADEIAGPSGRRQATAALRTTAHAGSRSRRPQASFRGTHASPRR